MPVLITEHSPWMFQSVLGRFLVPPDLRLRFHVLVNGQSLYPADYILGSPEWFRWVRSGVSNPVGCPYSIGCNGSVMIPVPQVRFPVLVKGQCPRSCVSRLRALKESLWGHCPPFLVSWQPQRWPWHAPGYPLGGGGGGVGHGCNFYSQLFTLRCFHLDISKTPSTLIVLLFIFG